MRRHSGPRFKCGARHNAFGPAAPCIRAAWNDPVETRFVTCNRSFYRTQPGSEVGALAVCRLGRCSLLRLAVCSHPVDLKPKWTIVSIDDVDPDRLYGRTVERVDAHGLAVGALF